MDTRCYKKPIRGVLAALLAWGFAMSAQAAPTSGQEKPAIVDLAPVAVRGVQPGPALWKIRKGGHVMWVLGVIKPLPKRMQWESAMVERAVAGSQVVLKAPGMEVGARVGLWGRLFLIPSMIGLKKLPDGKKLQDVLSPELYARWEAQRAKYLGGTWAVERLRPIFAGKKLYAAAIQRFDLTLDGTVEDMVLRFAKRNRVPVVDTSYVMVMDDPRADAKLFKQVNMDDQQCLSGILDATEQDLSQTRVRANAWATGDLEALRNMLSKRQQDECLSALGNTDLARKLGVTDISERIKQSWLKAAETSLAKNPQTLALLPMEQALAPHGYLAALQSAGYAVTATVDSTEVSVSD